MLRLNKRADMSIPIVLLVLLTLVLTSFSLYSFILREKNVEETIQVPLIIDVVYIEEAELNYYLQDIFDKSVSLNSAEFINNFENELSKYRDDGGIYLNKWLEQVEGQAENVEIDNGNISLVLDIKMKGRQTEGKRNVMTLDYNYKKRFEKNFLGFEPVNQRDMQMFP